MKFEPKLLIALGNPDAKYQNTYHNVGFLFVDNLEENRQILNFQISNFKSTEYMNKSGMFVAKELKRAGIKPENLLIVHDDSDIELGKYKLSFGRGAAGHHGVESVQTTLKTKNFWRLRIGIRPVDEKVRQKSEIFVLKKINVADKKTLDGVFAEISKTLAK